ncbi:hypothetical protein L7F22_056078 [Adiantum nelumboides]|nr:hypothetical protein [Adiantum nelumboides]
MPSPLGDLIPTIAFTVVKVETFAKSDGTNNSRLIIVDGPTFADRANGLLKNLHGSQQISNVAAEHATLADASKQDVNKLLGRAGARGAAARAKGSANCNAAAQKRGRKTTFPEGEENLYFQRNDKGDVKPPENLSVCGALASTLVDVKYGSSSGHSVLQESVTTMEHDIPKVSTHGLDFLKDVEYTGLKSGDAHECSSMEDGCEWEVGSTVFDGSDQEEEKAWDGEINIEMDMSVPDSSGKKARKRFLRRANAKDKEFAELVHKAHLLCMISRGRLVDVACDDPVLQASLLSIVPDHIHFQDRQQVTISELGRFVKWFQSTFQVLSDKSSTSSAREDLVPLLLDALQKQAGTSEEVAALSVSLLRALGVTARYVTVLDVISLKPDSSSLEASADWDAFKFDNGSFLQEALSTKIASSLGQAFSPCAPQTLAMAVTNTSACPTIGSTNFSRRQSLEGRGQQMTGEMKINRKQMVEDSGSKSQKRRKKIEFERTNDLQVSTKDHRSDGGSNIATDKSDLLGLEKKKKGDLEFELQLAMAMAATAGTAGESEGKVAQKFITKNDLSSSLEAKSPSNLEKGKSLHENTARLVASGSAVWSRKLGPLLNWAEVFCVEKDSGKWVHVDAGRGLLDGAELVEEAARSCRVPLRYVLAFAGNGAKDVTRRYVTLWSAVAPLRISNDWWNVTLAPLKELEAAGTSLDLKEEGGTGFLEKTVGASFSSSKVWTSSRQIKANDRSSLEDMELDIRAHTEPLPKSQQAYKNHHLYALERWLTKYQGLHPKGPILGYCAGHPVFPRACVQGLHTAERWLREGLKVRPHEVPAKIVKNPRSISHKNVDDFSSGIGECVNEAPTTALFGKWQTEPWHPPPAVDGIVPKNERGNVELWSEKCLPPGTVHISLPRILSIAKKLEIDFAPALVGFEIRSRRSVPVFEGIVVCQEYETVLLEAYAEEEHRRNIEAKKRKESLAVAKWFQLLKSIATRQRLEATYKLFQNDSQRIPANSSVLPQTLSLSESNVANHLNTNYKNHTAHEHFFPEQNESYDEQSGICTKVCACGFTLKVEEM